MRTGYIRKSSPFLLLLALRAAAILSSILPITGNTSWYTSLPLNIILTIRVGSSRIVAIALVQVVVLSYIPILLTLKALNYIIGTIKQLILYKLRTL